MILLTQATFGAINWLVLALYMLGMIAIGAWVSRKQRSEKDFFLAGRSMPAWAATLSMLATALSAATFIGVPELAFNGDLTYLSLNIGGMAAAIFVAFVFIGPLYRAGSLTIYGYLGQRYGSGAAIAASIAFVVGRLLASGARLFIAGLAFSLVLFGPIDGAAGIWPVIGAIVVFGAVGALYTAMGGVRAVIWTDVVQIIVVVGAAIFSIVLLLNKIPMDFGQILDALRHADSGDKLKVIDVQWGWAKSMTLWAAIAVVFAESAAYGVDHDLAQRLMTTRSAWRASASLIASKLLSIPVILLFLVIGLLLSIFYGPPQLAAGGAPEAVIDSKRVYPQFIVAHLPVGVAGLAMAGLFAAAMSSFDSAVNAMAASILADVIGPLRRRRAGASSQSGAGVDATTLSTSRWTVAVVAAALMGFAVAAAWMQQAGEQSLVDFALGVMSFAYAGLLGVFLTALLTKRGNVVSVIAALIVGALVVLALQPYVLKPTLQWLAVDAVTIAWPWWMALATPISFGVCCLGASNRTSNGVGGGAEAK